MLIHRYIRVTQRSQNDIFSVKVGSIVHRICPHPNLPFLGLCNFVIVTVASLHAQYFEQDESTDDEYQPLPEDWRKVKIYCFQ